MTARLYAYLGPFFRCYAHSTRVARGMRTCSNEWCWHRGIPAARAAKSCAACGEKLEDGVRVESTAVLPTEDDVRTSVRDALSCLASKGGVHCWAPNAIREGRPSRIAEDEESVTLDGDIDIRAEKEWLADVFAPEWARLDEAYGADEVTVEWGLIRYTMSGTTRDESR